MRLLLVAALALSPSAPAAKIGTTVAFTHHPYIEKLSCNGGSGSGFKLESGVWVSVYHVAVLGGCAVDGKPIVVTHADPDRDFITFVVPGDYRPGGIKPDCSGYHDGQWYYGTGHARGAPVLTSVPVMFSSIMDRNDPRGWKLLIYNRFIPGQSGGVVQNQWGEATGVINAYNRFYPISFSQPLQNTIICRS